MIQTTSSTRSIESASSSVCSDDPAMKRTLSRHAPLRRRSRDLSKKSVPSSRKLIKTTAGGLLEERNIENLSSSKSKLSSFTMKRVKKENTGTNISDQTDAIILKTKKNQRKRKVRFSATMSEVVCIVDHRDDLTAQEKNELYMSAENVQQIREDAKFVTKYFRSRSKEVIAEIDQAYCASLELATKDYISREEFMFSLLDDNSELQEAAATLNAWCSKTKVSGRGLERYCSAKQRAERGAFAAECRSAVLRLCGNKGVGSEDIANFYHEYARSCTLFSRMMGQQDQAAAQEAYLQMARKAKALAKQKEGNLMQIHDIVVDPLAPRASDMLQPQDIVLPSLVEDTTLGNTAHSRRSFDRRQLMALSKQHSSSARLLVERLSVGSNRVLGDTVQI